MNWETPLTAKQEKQKKFLLALPVLVLPFMTFLLWSVGLISNTPVKAGAIAAQKGFNTHLPDAKLPANKGWNKLNFYEQADKDSAKYKEQLKSDPFFGIKPLDTARHASVDNYTDPNEAKVNAKLAELNEALNKSVAASQTKPTGNQMPVEPVNIANNNIDVKRLENVVQAINQKDTGADPEMEKLNAMMDKIIQIQHPDMVQDKVKELSEQHKQEVLPVTVNNEADNVSSLQVTDTAVPALQNAFYSLDDNSAGTLQQNIIQAVVQETQTLVSGSTVKLRLTNDVYINGMLIPKHNLVYGTASLNGERLHIAVNSIRYGSNILPVALSVYDMDGLAGVFIPGAITRDVAKQSADESLQGIGLTTLDPSIGAQAASAGIQAAKTLIGKKVKLVKVTVKSGYQVFLKDNNNKQ